ncbi:MAG: UPF0280 family protein [Dehalococcoidales bacterium]|nr:UPF0280 family protein [Dehalococcoidales bacterium]
MNQEGYQPRDYRHWVESSGLVPFTVTVQETDLFICAGENLERKARRIVLKYRSQLEQYISKYPRFQASLEPLPIPTHAPRIVMNMIEAGRKAGVGPMAAVAGAVAEEVGKELLAFSPEIIVENGGDIFLSVRTKKIIALYAGDSPLTGKLGIEIRPEETPLGICTSSGTVGHSLSYGKADAAVVLSGSTALADAAATSIGNRVKQADDIDSAIRYGQEIEGVLGIVIIVGRKIGAWGNVTLRET